MIKFELPVDYIPPTEVLDDDPTLLFDPPFVVRVEVPLKMLGNVATRVVGLATTVGFAKVPKNGVVVVTLRSKNLTISHTSNPITAIVPIVARTGFVS